MKKTITIFTLACAVVLNLTACKDTSSGDESTSTQLPVNALNGTVEVNTSRSGSGNTSKDVPIASLPAVPEKGAMMASKTPLGEFLVNALRIDIAEPDLTPRKICERVGGDLENWKINYEDCSNNENFNSKVGYNFYGVGFSYAGSDAVYIEVEDENGKVVTDWQDANDKGEPYVDYAIKGVRFCAQASPTFVHFVCGVGVGDPLEYYEGLLGKGITVENIDENDAHNSYRLSIYKTPSVTMIIEYRLTEVRELFFAEESSETAITTASDESDNGEESLWYCESITLLRN